MRITQKDIAKKLGISLITVSRAFNNSGYVSPELKKRIFDYAKKQSYVPLRASQILVRNKTRRIAVFTSTFPSFVWDDIERGVRSAAEYIGPLNYEVRFFRIPDFDTEYYLKTLKQEIRNGLDAAAFLCMRMFRMKEIVTLAEKAGIPYIFYNVDDPETNRICYIGTDYSAGGRLAANLIGKSLGLKGTGKVLVIGINEDIDRMTDGPDINAKRIGGFLEVLNGRYPFISSQVEYINLKAKTGADAQSKQFLKDNEGRVDAVYFVPAYTGGFLDGLAAYDYRRTITLLHDVNDRALHCLENGLVTALVFQDLILQGYTAVRTLENILESKIRERQRDIEIVHTLIFKENINYLTNHYLLSQLQDSVNFEKDLGKSGCIPN
ncbi:MAG: LacI family transcriptional regulator [Spirochaetaceae bacterium]|jgi:LacI family transcriptional regulator|nr:LacI family transcriptional regulator [Spirochaetaceae bacterium]